MLSPCIILAEKTQKKLKYRISFKYYKADNGDKTLNARLYFKKNRKFVNVANEEVRLYVSANEEETLLAKINTNLDGEAILLIDSDYAIPWDTNQTCEFIARFAGNEHAKKAKKNIRIKDVGIGLRFSEKEDENKLSVLISSISPEKQIIPAEEILVYAYVDRMYSLLPIGEGFTDEQGELDISFPKNIPGDSLGNLTVIVKIEDSDEHGNIEVSKTIKWGIPVDYTEQLFPRSLWTDNAPYWMYLVIIIILGGAWIHFVLAVYKLFKIKELDPKK
ncbi:MAG: hypothetical protein B7C24_04600 [Bacteroidetes bacterium 4572_77]|nr:MAG: hypothetical protein B7C24_04600 [Bacteroidetes bacterium 4572_77]